jgi:Fibronectin type III domain
MSSTLPDGTPPAVAPAAVAPASPGASPLAGTYVGATLPAPGPPRRSRRTKIAIGVTAGLAFIAGIVVVVLNPPQVPRVPPVLRPVGLSAISVTYTTVQIIWSAPRTGPRPTSYWILEDGGQIGSVPGRVTAFEVTGLSPNTTYVYQVVAIRQHRLSRLSAAVQAATLAPPSPSDALLTGPFTVHYSHVTAYGYVHDVRQLPDDDWKLFAGCNFGPCPAVLRGTFWGYLFRATLRPSGTGYKGTIVIKKFNKCSDVTSALPLYLTYSITIRGAVADGLEWMASSWSGTVQATQPLTACAATGITARVQGTLIGGSAGGSSPLGQAAVAGALPWGTWRASRLP